jgi:hypothetical protein
MKIKYDAAISKYEIAFTSINPRMERHVRKKTRITHARHDENSRIIHEYILMKTKVTRRASEITQSFECSVLSPARR